MPVYQFSCDGCKQDVELTHGFNKPHPKKHKGCGGKLKRKFTAPDIVYKGAGFFSTDKRLDLKPEDE
jgi:putative FmdB family regulatory protein